MKLLVDKEDKPLVVAMTIFFLTLSLAGIPLILWAILDIISKVSK